MCIEHKGGMWQVKLVSEKMTADCMAMITGGFALEACALQSWRVYDDRHVLTEQPNVKMLTGSDAERKVSSRCTHVSLPFFSFVECC